VATYVTLHNQLTNIPDIYHAQDFDFSATKEFDRKNGYRSVSSLTVPLKNHLSEVIGVLQLFNAQDPDTGQVVPFDRYQQLVVTSLASLAALNLNTQMLLERQKELLKFELDLQIGRQIQADFLPKQLPQLPGWEISARFQPAREVAGDFYDVFHLSGDRIALVIADVVDKGVGAALFMALSRSLLRAFAEQHRTTISRLLSDDQIGATAADIRHRLSLSAEAGVLGVVKLTNDYIAKNHADLTMFATLFFGVLDPQMGSLTYINAGHDPPAIISSTGEVKARLMPTGPAMGMLPDMDFDILQVTLEPGDTLMTFTDGVTDANLTTLPCWLYGGHPYPCPRHNWPVYLLHPSRGKCFAWLSSFDLARTGRFHLRLPLDTGFARPFVAELVEGNPRDFEVNINPVYSRQTLIRLGASVTPTLVILTALGASSS
jgi:sigma-B regulation protein RsbU (phosphoserine phosphatase)